MPDFDMLLGGIECMRCRLLLPMCAVSVRQSVCHAAQLVQCVLRFRCSLCQYYCGRAGNQPNVNWPFGFFHFVSEQTMLICPAALVDPVPLIRGP